MPSPARGETCPGLVRGGTYVEKCLWAYHGELVLSPWSFYVLCCDLDDSGDWPLWVSRLCTCMEVLYGHSTDTHVESVVLQHVALSPRMLARMVALLRADAWTGTAVLRQPHGCIMLPELSRRPNTWCVGMAQVLFG